MKNLLFILLFSVFSSRSLPVKHNNVKLFATCKGNTPCHACKNCKYFKRYAKDGLTCGVCKKSNEF